MEEIKNNQVTKKEIEELLGQQTTVILDAVDEKINRVDQKIINLDARVGNLEIKVDRLEQRMAAIEEKMEQLIATIDKFLKRLTDIEDEFVIMKHDINRMKKIIKDKLGVEL